MALDCPSYTRIFLEEGRDAIKPIRMDLLRFRSPNVKSWLFTAKGTSYIVIFYMIKKILLASFHIDDLAQGWFTYMETSNLLTTWQQFTVELLKRFSPFSFSLLGDKLGRLF